MKPISIKHVRSGPSISDRVRFTALFEGRPTSEDISDAQAADGYHPCGYGGPWVLNIEERPDHTFQATWTCSASCD